MKRALLLVSLWLAGTLALADPFVWPSAWTGGAPEDANRGGTFRHWSLGGDGTFNPFVSAGGDALLGITDWENGARLIRQAPGTGEWIPYAAESFTVAEDGRTVRLVLREELRWSDGTPITARDYLFRYEAEIDPDVQSIQYEHWHVGDERIHMSIEGDRGIEFRFPAPDRTMFEAVAMNPAPDHILGEIYREGGAEALRAAWGTDTPVGDTVWSSAFVPESYVPGERVVFRRNEHFGGWNVDEAGAPLPYVDTFLMTEVNSVDTAMNLFLAGEFEVYSPGNLDELGVLAVAIDNGDLDAVLMEDAVIASNATFFFFNWNLASDPYRQELFRSRAFRRAMSHLVDRRAIVELVYSGAAEPMWSAVYRSMGDWVAEDVPRFSYDPEAALDLLASIGFDRTNDRGVLVDEEGNELSFTLTTNSGSRVREQMAQIIADTAREVGVEVEVQAVDFNLMGDWIFTEGDDRPFHAILLGLGGAPRSWPFNADEWPCDALLHIWNASDTCLSPVETLLEELYFQGRQELDPDTARAIAHEMQRHIAELQAQIFLPTPNWHLAFDARLRNLYTAELIAEGWGPFELATVYLVE